MDVYCVKKMDPAAASMTRIQSHTLVTVRNLGNHKVHGISMPLMQRRAFGAGFRTCDHVQTRKMRQLAKTVTEDEVVKVGGDGDEAFDWNKAWYPVRLVEDLEPKKPTAVELLGRQFVLWRDKNEEWRCFKDMCPHRLARLSEGRIEASDGTLVCSYHGWRFDEEGACKLIPQQESPPQGSLPPRSSVMGFPVKVEANVIWIWPDESEAAFIDSAMVEPYGMECESDEFVMTSPMFTRDLPYSFDILLENSMDPSHVSYAHHGVQGNRDKEGWMRAKLRDPDNKSEMKVDFESVPNADIPVEKQTVLKRNMEYSPPNYIHYEHLREDQTEIFAHQRTYVIPTSASCSKIFFDVLVQKVPLTWFARLKALLSKPTWADHLYRHAVLDGDAIFLTEQGNILRSGEAAGKPWDSLFFTPSSADLAVVMFRRWLHNGPGGGGPKLPDGQPLLQKDFATRSRKDILKRYKSHTKHCKACSNALWWVRFGKVAAQVLACMIAAWGLLTVQQAQTGTVKSIGSCWGIFAAAIAKGLVAYNLFKLENAFIFKNYEQWKS